MQPSIVPLADPGEYGGDDCEIVIAPPVAMDPLLTAAQALDLPEGRGFVWIAAEARVAKALKHHFLNDRGHPGPELKAAGYWVAGTAGESDKSLE